LTVGRRILRLQMKKKHFNVLITDVSKVQSPITSDEFVNFRVVQFSTAITAAKLPKLTGK